MIKSKASVEEIARYHWLLLWLAEQKRGRPSPSKCVRREQ